MKRVETACEKLQVLVKVRKVKTWDKNLIRSNFENGRDISFVRFRGEESGKQLNNSKRG
jgi:hypothetical protein